MSVLKTDLSKYAGAAPQIGKQTLKDTADTMLQIIKQFVPVDTGDLRDSYTWESIDDDTIIIGSNQFRGVYRRGYPTYYAPYVEYGLGYAPYAQPHFTPAWERAEQIFVARFKTNFRKL